MQAPQCSSEVKKATKMMAGAMATALSRELIAQREDAISYPILRARDAGEGAWDLELDMRQRKPLPDSELELGRVQMGEKWIAVELERQIKNGVRVVANVALDPSVMAGATLEIDQSWLLERQIAVMREIVGEIDRSLDGGFRYELALQALNHPLGAEASPTTVEVDIQRSAEVLNEQQLQCLARCSNAAVTLVWGPPGTGKSTTLTEIAVAHALAGQRVLIATPSNSTADQLATACMRRYKAAVGRDFDAQVIRWGPRVKKLSPADKERLMPAQVAERQAAKYLHDLRTVPCIASMNLVNTVIPLDPTPELLRRWASEVFARAQIVVCPMAQLYLNRTQFQGAFDTLLIDEASMMLPPTIWIAAGLPRSRVIIAGDPMQLGAPVQTSETELRKDIFRRHIPCSDSDECSGATWIMLTEQFRMVPGISDFVSSQFYEGRLRTAPAIIRDRTPMSWPMEPSAGSLILIDTSGAGRSVDKSYGGHAVLENATIATDIVRQIAGDSTQPSTNSILVLSAYRAQGHLIRALLKRNAGLPPSSIQPVVSTIHAAQGDEVDVVVLTIDDDPTKPVFLRGADGPRLLNVAISRARRGVLVVGPIKRLSQSQLVAPTTRRILQSFEETSFALPAGMLAMAI